MKIQIIPKPKYAIGQRVYWYRRGLVEKLVVQGYMIREEGMSYRLKDQIGDFSENDFFRTDEEARKAYLDEHNRSMEQSIVSLDTGRI